MKILHISDTHGFHHDMNQELPEADVLVHSGDFTWGGSEAEAIDFMNWLIGLPYRYKVFIAGNHDFCMYQADGIQGLPDNVHFLQHSSVAIDGFKFYGIPLYMEDCIAGRYDLLLDEIPTDVDILITHQPPFGVLDITDYGNGPMNHGSRKLKEKVASHRPKAHLFGHEHSANGLIEENGTIFSNGSLLDDNYKQSFTPRLSRYKYNMKNYKDKECERQQTLIKSTGLFDGISGGGRFMGKERPFVLTDGSHNLYAFIREEAIKYFRDNNIGWWGGSRPSGHVLSSQIACVNHLFSVRKDADTVLSMLNNVRNEFTEVLPISSDAELAYIAFEVVSDHDHLNEGSSTRGSNCTSIDALIYARHKSGEKWLIPIEWKYTEHYNNQDKSNEDRDGEEKGSNGKGRERMSRYNDLISASVQLKSLEDYAGSLYYYEPFYQLMRQTLWAENMVAHKDSERLAADNYLHIHVIPSENDELLQKKYKVSDDTMEKSWRGMLANQSKYVIISPETLLAPVSTSYPELTQYLSARYWNNK